MNPCRQISTGLLRFSKATMKDISQLFRQKYNSANNTNDGRICFNVADCSTSRAIPDVLTTTLAETHADRAGAVKLNSARIPSGRRLAIQKAITRPSKVTISVPAAAP